MSVKPLVFKTSEPRVYVYRLTVAIKCIDARNTIVHHLASYMNLYRALSSDTENEDRLYIDIDSLDEKFPQAAWKKIRRLSRGKPRFEVLSHSIRTFRKSKWNLTT